MKAKGYMRKARRNPFETDMIRDERGSVRAYGVRDLSSNDYVRDEKGQPREFETAGRALSYAERGNAQERLKDDRAFSGSGFEQERAWRYEALVSQPKVVSAARAKAIMEQARKGGVGPWSDQLSRVMSKGEYRYVNDVWEKQPGSASFAGTLMGLANGHIKANPKRNPPKKRNPSPHGAVTLYFTGPMGAISYKEGKLVGVDAHGVEFIPKGGRREQRLMTYYSPFIMAVRGWGHPKPGSGFTRPVAGATSGVMVSRGLYRSTDSRWVSDFMRDVGGGLKPVVLFQDGRLVQGKVTEVIPTYPHMNPKKKNPSAYNYGPYPTLLGPAPVPTPPKKANPVKRQHSIPELEAYELGVKLRYMTHHNQHPEAALFLARNVLHSPTFTDKVRALNAAHDRAGYLTPELNAARMVLLRRMWAQLKRRTTPRGYDLIHGSM